MWCFRVLFVIVVVFQAAAARAQIPARPNQWTRATQLTVLVGAADGSATTGPMVGAAVGWEVTRWIAVEGRGSWFDGGAQASAFGADLNALVNIVARRAVTPFVGAGFGLYRASFDSAAAAVPDFYRMRMGTQSMGTARAFTDPAVRVTAGVDLIARRHWRCDPRCR